MKAQVAYKKMNEKVKIARANEGDARDERGDGAGLVTELDTQETIKKEVRPYKVGMSVPRGGVGPRAKNESIWKPVSIGRKCICCIGTG